MKGQELLSLEDWVLKNCKGVVNTTDKMIDVLKLSKLLKSTPKLGDFVACDEDGKPLDKPEFYDEHKNFHIVVVRSRLKGRTLAAEQFKAYQEAEQRVLWEGDWKVIDEGGKYYVIHGEDYLVWNKSDGTFDIKVDMIFFRGKDNWTYADLINDEGLESEGLMFKRDL